MNISFENLGKVRKSFEKLVERNNILDADYPYFNAYTWLNKEPGGNEEILFSAGYRSPHLAREMSDNSNAEPTIANAGENDVAWLGVFDASRIMIPGRK